MSSVHSDGGGSGGAQFGLPTHMPPATTTYTTNTQKTTAERTHDTLSSNRSSNQSEVEIGEEHSREIGTNSSGIPLIESPGSNATLYGGGKWFTAPALLAFYNVMANVLGKELIKMEEELSAMTIQMMGAEYAAAKDSKELGLAAAELEKKMAMFAAVGCFVQAAGSIAAGATTLGMLGASRAYSSYQSNQKSTAVDQAQARQDRVDTYQQQYRDDPDAFRDQYQNENVIQQQNITAREDNKAQLQGDRANYEQAQRDYENNPTPQNAAARDDAKRTVEQREAEGQALDKDLARYDDMKAVIDKHEGSPADKTAAQAHLDGVANDLASAKADYERLKSAQQSGMMERTTAIQAASQMMGAINSVGQSLEHIGKILYVVEKAWYEGEQKLVETLMRHFGQLIGSLNQDRQDIQKTIDSLQDTLKSIFQQTTQNQRISSSAA